jgi:putative transposase
LLRSIISIEARYAMQKDTKDREMSPARLGMKLEELLREGARGLIEQAVAVELAELLEGYENVKMLQDHQAVVRNGYTSRGFR